PCAGVKQTFAKWGKCQVLVSYRPGGRSGRCVVEMRDTPEPSGVPPMRAFVLRGSVAAAVLIPTAVAFAAAPTPVATGVHAARGSAPVVLTGAQLPQWSRLPAEGVAQPYPSGATTTGDGKRTAHNGRLVV